MCIISDKTKFCTCVDDNVDIEELNHYWVLYRYNKNKNLVTIGSIMPSFEKFSFNHLENHLKISNVLNTNETFDKQINFKEKDRLEVVLNNNSKNLDEVNTFEFEYKSGKWESLDSDNDPFYLMNFFDEINSGEIKEID